MLSHADERRLAAHLELALGYLEISRHLLTGSAGEFELRTGFSRLYYAFFHVAQAYLLSTGMLIGRLEHGEISPAIDARLGKRSGIGRFISELYGHRLTSDYVPQRLAAQYNGSLEEARVYAVGLIRRAGTTFNFLYYGARKVL